VVSLQHRQRFFPFLVDPSMIEALGAWNAGKLGCDLGLSHMQLERDALKYLVEALKKEGPCWNLFGHLIVDTRACLSQVLSYSVLHVQIEANTVAHKLAKLALSQLLDEVWLDECPFVIRNVIIAEQDAID
jgi:hypothetical protein